MTRKAAASKDAPPLAEAGPVLPQLIEAALGPCAGIFRMKRHRDRFRKRLAESVLVTVAIVSAPSAVSVEAATRPASTPASTPASCAPNQGLQFICGAERPEDLARIPGTRWLVASGFSNGAGLKLVDTDAHTMRLWYSGDPKQIRHGKQSYERCPSAPDAKTFNAQGISLRTSEAGRHTLYVVNHGGRESVEIFAIDSRADEPALTWIGCVLMPQGVAANSAAAYSDGTILASVLTHPGTTITDFVGGKTTGGVYEWRRGAAGFTLLPGTELPGNNGIEISRDDKEFYVVAFGWRSVVVFSRANSSIPLRKAAAPGFMPDNIHWDGDRLILAGMQYDEPACGGTRKIIDGKADDMRCHRGYVVAQLDPATMAFSVLAYSQPNPDFNGVSAASVIGNHLWLASYQADRIAFRALPGIQVERPVRQQADVLP